MKRILPFILTAIFVFMLFSCNQNTVVNITEEYTLTKDNASEMYTNAVENLTSGEIGLKYSSSNGVKSTTVKFAPTQNGEKKVLAEIKYTDGGYVTNYFDGENFYVIVDGQGKQIESEYVNADSIYKNLVGLPEEYTVDESFKVYKSNDNTGYLITGEVEYETEEPVVEKVTVYYYLNNDKIPQKYRIEFYILDVENEETKEYIDGVYKNLGTKITINAPEFEQIQE